MPSLFRHCLLPVAVILFLAIGTSGCMPLTCPGLDKKVSVVDAYTRDVFRSGDRVYDKPANTWVDNPKMAAFVANYIERNGVKWLGIRYGFECTPKPGGDCPDCFVCTLARPGVINDECQPDGDLFVKAEIGPGTSVRAMTYWRR